MEMLSPGCYTVCYGEGVFQVGWVPLFILFVTVLGNGGLLFGYWGRSLSFALGVRHFLGGSYIKVRHTMGDNENKSWAWDMIERNRTTY